LLPSSFKRRSEARQSVLQPNGSWSGQPRLEVPGSTGCQTMGLLILLTASLNRVLAHLHPRRLTRWIIHTLFVCLRFSKRHIDRHLYQFPRYLGTLTCVSSIVKHARTLLVKGHRPISRDFAPCRFRSADRHSSRWPPMHRAGLLHRSRWPSLLWPPQDARGALMRHILWCYDPRHASVKRSPHYLEGLQLYPHREVGNEAQGGSFWFAICSDCSE
jgi:hypothetical protein